MKTKILVAALCLGLFACKEINLASFEEPQPQNVRAINEIPKKISGNYYDYENNISLFISRTYICKSEKHNDTLNISLLSPSEKISESTYYNSKTNEQYKINRINDTLFSGYVEHDTLFNLKEKDMLKKFKGSYFLNIYVEDTIWIVKKLNYSQGVLNISEISTENDLKILEDVTHTKRNDSLPLNVKPTKKQFKEFVKKQGFTKGETYLKINE